MKIQFEVPFLPPSVNKAYYTDFNTRTRHKTKAYREFANELVTTLPKHVTTLLQGKEYLVWQEALKVEYNFYFPNKIRRDVGNYEKCLTDVLVKLGFMKDDCLIQRIVLEKYVDKDNPCTVILLSDEEDT